MADRPAHPAPNSAANPAPDTTAAPQPSPPRGRLYVVATPIGNLGDMSARALETLRSVRLVAAEDTRHTGHLLRHFQVKVPTLSYHAHNRAERLPRILGELQQGDVALVTDAGTPLISDPGQELVAAAAGAGFQVVVVPGPSAPVAALAVSGLPADTFHFIGFLPRRAGERRRRLAQIATWPGSIILFEAPHRLRAALADLLAALGDRQVAICCELTKLYERVDRTTLGRAVEQFAQVEPRGEYTLVVAGAGEAAPAPQAQTPADVRQRFAELERDLGDRRRALAALAAETGRPRKELYAELVAKTAGSAASSRPSRKRPQRARGAGR